MEVKITIGTCKMLLIASGTQLPTSQSQNPGQWKFCPFVLFYNHQLMSQEMARKMPRTPPQLASAEWLPFHFQARLCDSNSEFSAIGVDVKDLNTL